MISQIGCTVVYGATFVPVGINLFHFAFCLLIQTNQTRQQGYTAGHLSQTNIRLMTGWLDQLNWLDWLYWLDLVRQVELAKLPRQVRLTKTNQMFTTCLTSYTVSAILMFT